MDVMWSNVCSKIYLRRNCQGSISDHESSFVSFFPLGDVAESSVFVKNCDAFGSFVQHSMIFSLVVRSGLQRTWTILTSTSHWS